MGYLDHVTSTSTANLNIAKSLTGRRQSFFFFFVRLFKNTCFLIVRIRGADNSIRMKLYIRRFRIKRLRVKPRFVSGRTAHTLYTGASQSASSSLYFRRTPDDTILTVSVRVTSVVVSVVQKKRKTIREENVKTRFVTRRPRVTLTTENSIFASRVRATFCRADDECETSYYLYTQKWNYFRRTRATTVPARDGSLILIYCRKYAATRVYNRSENDVLE